MLEQRFINRVYSVFSSVKSFKSTSDELTEKMEVLRKGLPKKTSQKEFYFIHGMLEYFRQDLFQNHLEFCYKVEGKLYSVVRKSERYYENTFTPKELHDRQESNGFYWIGTDKPFFIGKDE